MKCEMKHLDRLYDDKDEQYYKERKEEVEKPEQKDWWRLFAFCIIREYYDDGELEAIMLYVNHQPVRQLLSDIIGDYPDNPIDVNDVQIEAPYHSLFYYRKEIEEEGLSRFKGDEESAAQVRLLVDWIKTHFEHEIAAYDKCVTGDLRAIAYDQLWTLFPPGEVTHSKVLEQDRGFRVTSSWYGPGAFNLRTDFVDFDGEKIGTRKADFFIARYSGTRQLQQLPTMPLRLIDDADAVRAAMVARGRRFEAYVGQHYAEYDGVALDRTGEGTYARVNVRGRIMIDGDTYRRFGPSNNAFYVTEMKKNKGDGNGDGSSGSSSRSSRSSGGRDDHRPPKTFQPRAVNHIGFAPVAGAGAKKTFDPLSDEEAAVTVAMVRGYAFPAKSFLEFLVDKVAPIEWNAHCFDDLVLDQATKKTVQAVVSKHASSRDSFDDIVKGKGQGLVCVLHGPPGVGKTLTAECVAEYVQRPLYMVSLGDLGVSSGYLDTNLGRVMTLATAWGAVLVIDEADVFLEQRALHDVHRNTMVSVFLRALEYYSGILFLTTNRVRTFDDALRSRVHIPIRYTDLSAASRLQVWRTLCNRVPGGVDVDEDALKELASHELNGRQIKNIIKAAESQAAFDGIRVDHAQLLQVAKIHATFEHDLTNFAGVDYKAPGEPSKGDENYMFL
ncbi:P-loop containing nucleoside triphosphate hydrolase protein [Hypoxylon sp. FL1284]|nr:P-loop containing nucleoside triphosphate hydrolase protein [Hypoxylon sp. FL1284]